MKCVCGNIRERKKSQRHLLDPYRRMEPQLLNDLVLCNECDQATDRYCDAADSNDPTASILVPYK